MKARTLFAIMFAGLSLVCAEEIALRPITQQETARAVAAYLRSQGLSEEQLPKADDLELPGTIPAADGRALRVAAVCWDLQMDRATYRLECTEAGACLPFLVSGGISEPGFRALRSSPETAVSSACWPRSGTRSLKSRPEIVVRSGDRATVVFRGNHLRLSQQVSCLERGAVGDMIRVRNSDGALFRARVVSPGLLEAVPQ